MIIICVYKTKERRTVICFLKPKTIFFTTALICRGFSVVPRSVMVMDRRLNKLTQWEIWLTRRPYIESLREGRVSFRRVATPGGRTLINCRHLLFHVTGRWLWIAAVYNPNWKRLYGYSKKCGLVLFLASACLKTYWIPRLFRSKPLFYEN